MGALADREVGDYFARHFVATYQRVGTFQIVGGKKQGGNVAGYFCRPDQRVVHVIPGPVNARTLLREARWAVETAKHAAMVAQNDLGKWRPLLRKAHLERLQQAHGVSPQRLKLPSYTAGASAAHAVVLRLPHGPYLNNQGRAHHLLASYPLVELGRVYQVVFEGILKEKISMLPVAQR